MKNLRPLLFVVLLIGLLGKPALSYEPVRASGGSDEVSLDWQKLNLEEAIDARARSVLSALTGGDEFYVHTQISTRDPHVTKMNGSAPTTVRLGKLDMSVEVKNLTLESRETIFDLIQNIEVVATIPKGNFALNQDLLQKALSSALRGFTRAPIAVHVDSFETLKKASDVASADPKADPKSNLSPEEKEKQRMAEAAKKPLFDFQTDLPKFLVPLSILLSSLLFAVILFRLMNVYRGVENRRMDMLEKQSAPSSRPSAPEEAAGAANRNGAARGAGLKAPVHNQDQRNLDQQIRSIVETSPQKLLVLIRQWLASDDVTSLEALCGLPTILPVDSLLKLVEKLDESTKRKWRGNFNKDLEDGYEDRARRSIYEQLVTEIMSEASPVSAEIGEMLEGIRPDECAELGQNDLELGAVLGCILSTPQAARMLSLMPEDLAGQLATRSLMVGPTDIERQLPRLRDALERVRSGVVEKTDSKHERAVKLLNEVGPLKESMLFASFAGLFDRGELSLLAAAVHPTEVILQAPVAVHRECLATLPLAQRADLIYALPTATRDLMLQAYPPEERIRELLDAEMSQIDVEPQRKQRVLKEADKQWRAYIALFRRQAKINPQFEPHLQPLLEAWIEARVRVKPHLVGESNAA